MKKHTNPGIDQNFISNYYKVRQFHQSYLIVTDYGNWAIFSKEEYQKLLSGMIDGMLLKKLSGSGIILTNENIIKEIEDCKSSMSFMSGCCSNHAIVFARKNLPISANETNIKQISDFIFTSPSKKLLISFQGPIMLCNFHAIESFVSHLKQNAITYGKDVSYSIIMGLDDMNEDNLAFLLSNDFHIKFLFKPKIANNEESYAKQIEWIKRIQKESILRHVSEERISVSIQITKSHLNKPKEIIDTLRDFGIDKFELFSNNRFGNESGKSSENYDAEEYLMFWRSAVDYLIELNLSGIKIIELDLKHLLSKIFNSQVEETEFRCLRSPCGAIISNFAYTLDGKIYPCMQAALLQDSIFEIGDIKDNSLKEIVQTDSSRKIISLSMNESHHCINCVYRPFCGVCLVCNYRENSSVIAPILAGNRCKELISMFDYIFAKLLDPNARQVLQSWLNMENIYKFSTTPFNHAKD